MTGEAEPPTVLAGGRPLPQCPPDLGTADPTWASTGVPPDSAPGAGAGGAAPLPGGRGGLPGVGRGLLPGASRRSAGGVDQAGLSRLWGIFFHLGPFSRLPGDGRVEAAPFALQPWAGGLVGWWSRLRGARAAPP